MNSFDPHMLTGAYVLDALDSDAERQAVERHLDHCPSCAHEVDELAETAARLGQAVAETVGPTLRAAVLRRITTVRQEPPYTTAFDGGAVAAGRGRSRRGFPRWALAASLAGTVALGGFATAWQYDRAEEAARAAREATAEAESVAAVLAAPDARLTTARLAGGAVGTVVYAPSADRAAFAASALPRPPAGSVYQLWYADGDVMRPAGLLPADTTTSTTLLAGRVNEASAIGITLEPAGGSPRPTTAPLAVIALPTV
ncbi:anti-sigma factor [Streptomyces sp. NPDC026092]|uniref:anti-sigma factor n=1 Tax=Streptomyces sp. NPDC026092 TaxID=3154797 RepID=UPI0033D18324